MRGTGPLLGHAEQLQKEVSSAEQLQNVSPGISWNYLELERAEREHRAADLNNGGAWCHYDEVDLKPGKSNNAGEFNYGKEGLAKEDAI